MNNTPSNTDTHRPIKKKLRKTLGERDYAAQETMHYLLCLTLGFTAQVSL